MTEPQLLAATGLLAFLLVLPPLVALIMNAGWGAAFGNRADLAPRPEWAQRASRAQRNMVDTLVPFTAIVLAVQLAGVSNEQTQLGAGFSSGVALATPPATSRAFPTSARWRSW